MNDLRQMTISFWIAFAFFGVVFLYALPSLVKLLLALLRGEAKWPGDRHYAEPKNLRGTAYTDWYLKGDAPLFAVFVFNLLGVLATAVLTLAYAFNVFGLLEKAAASRWNPSIIVFMVLELIGAFCAIQVIKKLKFIKKFFNSFDYRYEKEKRQSVSKK